MSKKNDSHKYRNSDSNSSYHKKNMLDGVCNYRIESESHMILAFDKTNKNLNTSKEKRISPKKTPRRTPRRSPRRSPKLNKLKANGLPVIKS